MKTDQLLQYLDQQEAAIQALGKQLDEVQVAFNAQYDQFKAQHDAALARVTDRVAARYAAPDRDGAVPPALRAAVQERLPDEQHTIEQRRDDVRSRYLPDRQKAADELLAQAQAELAEVRALNPQLDEKEEALKKQKAGLEGQLAALNDQIRSQSRGLGVVTHLLSITRADQERQRIVGRLEMVNSSLLEVRREWQQKHDQVGQHQAEMQSRWQLESIAVARLQAELDQLSDPDQAADLALRRSVYQALDVMTEPAASPDAELDAELRQVVELNRQTDAYQAGLASVAGLMGLLKGIGNGLGAIRESVQGLKHEQEMHSSYLKPLSFELPAEVQAFHEQWPALDERFADEKAIAAHPAEFSDAVKPLVEQALSQARIEAMFNALGNMITQATRHWS